MGNKYNEGGCSLTAIGSYNTFSILSRNPPQNSRDAPFQAIYNLPLTILTSNNTDPSGYFQAIAIQFFWVVVMIILSALFWKKSIKVITVNGG